MDNFIKSAPSYSGISDSAYDRSEDAETKMQNCEHCEGHGVIYYCLECDNSIKDCGCLENQVESSEKCDYCYGEGEVEI
jgi:hypothetical protein